MFKRSICHPVSLSLKAGGLDELLINSPAWPFPRAVHLRARRDRDPDRSSSEEDEDDEDDGINKEVFPFDACLLLTLDLYLCFFF